MDEENIVKNNKKKGKGGLILVVLIILAIIALGIYYFASSKSVNVFKTATNTVVKNAEELLDKEEKYKNIKSDLEFSVNFDTNNDITNLINKLNVKMTNYVEIENSAIESKIELQNGDEKLLNAVIGLDNKNIKMASSELFSKSINISKKSIENMLSSLGITLEESKEFNGDINIILERFKTILNEQLDKQKYIKENVETKIDDSTIQANKNTLEFTIKELINFLKELETNLKADKEFIQAIDTRKTFLFDNFDELIQGIKEFDESYGEDAKVNISIYTKGITNEFVKFEILILDEISCYGVEAYKKAENDFIVNVALSDEAPNLNNAESIIKYEITDEMIKIDGEEFSGIIKYTENSIDMSINTEILGTNAEIKLIGNFEENVNYEKYDFENAIDIEELTDEDINEIFSNLEQSKLFSFLSPIIELYSSILAMSAN